MTGDTTGDGPQPGRQAQGQGSIPTLLYAVKQVELATRALLDDLLKAHGVTALQYTALTVLARRPLTAAELARNSFVRAQSMADLVSALERLGLVERIRDEGDRRRVQVSLTARGRALVQECAEPVSLLEARMVEGMSPAEVEALRGALDRCRRNLGDGPVR